MCDESRLTSADKTTYNGKARFPDVRTMVLADIKGWFPQAGLELTDDQVDDIVQQAELALQTYISPDGSVEFPMPTHFILLVK